MKAGRFAGDWGRVAQSVGSRLDLRAALSASFSSAGFRAPPSLPVGANPSGIAVDAATHTAYVVNQGDDTVSVVDANACNAADPEGCGQPLATITLGPGGLASGPVSAVVSPDGGTLYVSSPGGANDVAVIDASDCRAENVTGCADAPVATVATGQGPLDLAEDPDNQTLYVANIEDNTVSVIDAAHCNAQDTGGCSVPAPTVPVGNGPLAVAVDSRTHTVYVANIGDDTVSVINADGCNAEHPAGCSHTPPVQAVGGAPDAIAVAIGTDTVYVANSGNGLAGLVPGGNTVSVLNTGACNGQHLRGCSMVPPPAVAVGGGQDNQPESLAVDRRTHNVYEVNSSDDTISVIDGARCNALHPAGCAQPAPSVQTGAEPTAVAVDPYAHTVYVSESADNAVAVIADHACAGHDPAGCRPAPAPATALAAYHQLTGAAVDAAEHTAYMIDDGATGDGPFVLDLLNTRRCNADTTAGCNPHPPLATVALTGNPSDLVFDPSTNTLYVSEGGGGPGPQQLEVIAAATCNAVVHSCAKTATIPFGTNTVTGPVVVDSATRTVYVGEPTSIAVVDARHCNATDMTGCATQTPATIPVPFGGITLAPDTLYVTGFAAPDTPGWVNVIATRHCNAGDSSQCATQANPPRVAVGIFADDAAVDPAHHTLYVVDNGSNQVSMVATTHCNGDDSTACASQTPATIPLPRNPFRETFDPFNSTLYVTNFSNASVSSINTATCNATILAGCRHAPQVVVGSGPWSSALDPSTDTIYVPNFYDGTVSLVATKH